MSTPTSIDYAIQTVQRSDGARDYRLMINHRDGRGLIEDVRLQLVAAQVRSDCGYIMSFTAHDGMVEQIGTAEAPLPVELIDASETDRGLAIITLAGNGFHAQVTGGQILWTTPCVNAPRQRAVA